MSCLEAIIKTNVIQGKVVSIWITWCSGLLLLLLWRTSDILLVLVFINWWHLLLLLPRLIYINRCLLLNLKLRLSVNLGVLWKCWKKVFSFLGRLILIWIYSICSSLLLWLLLPQPSRTGLLDNCLLSLRWWCTRLLIGFCTLIVEIIPRYDLICNRFLILLSICLIVASYTMNWNIIRIVIADIVLICCHTWRLIIVWCIAKIYETIVIWFVVDLWLRLIWFYLIKLILEIVDFLL